MVVANKVQKIAVDMTRSVSSIFVTLDGGWPVLTGSIISTLVSHKRWDFQKFNLLNLIIS